MERRTGDELDIIKLFIGAMTVLTLFVAAFGIQRFTWARSSTNSTRMEKNKLGNMKKKVYDRAFQVKCDRIREKISMPNPEGDLQSFIMVTAQNHKVEANRVQPSKPQKMPGYQKRSFIMEFKDVPIRPFVRFLDDLQQKWPGLKIESISMTPDRRKKRSWNVTTTIAEYTQPQKKS